ncbi:hypothetical protein FNV43_RR00765 [Rhamnella rubrinervis]|uniref:Uncharacterized protein n=1 Tax=Rhamnella rubrinervis TaxID=2594499 RepID=A0A8K0HNL5_9ROSA|nr:hypothetical protein FNV43_RR00765 [Rhamnella rubrinervis]
MTQISHPYDAEMICRRRRALLLSICQFEGKGEEPDLKEELGGCKLKGVALWTREGRACPFLSHCGGGRTIRLQGVVSETGIGSEPAVTAGELVAEPNPKRSEDSVTLLLLCEMCVWTLGVVKDSLGETKLRGWR